MSGAGRLCKLVVGVAGCVLSVVGRASSGGSRPAVSLWRHHAVCEFVVLCWREQWHVSLE